MLLRSLLEAAEPLAVAAPFDLQVDALTADSRQVGPGHLFVAVPSVGGDLQSGGVRFLPDVVAAGALAVVLPPGITPPDGIPHAVVADTRAALADLSAAFYGHPSRETRLYAVTGTDGKTTTATLLRELLAGAGKTTGLVGTVRTMIGDEILPNPERVTTPESIDLQRLLRRMVGAEVGYVAMEASSHALVLDRLRGCSFAAVALTNVTGDHLEFHGSWEAYVAAKTSLFTHLAAGRPAVLNQDDPVGADLAPRLNGPVLTYSVHGGADLIATGLRADGHGMAADLTAFGERAELWVPLPGRFNVANALAALGLALLAGLRLDEALSGLRAARPPAGRLERIEAGQSFEVLVDYAHTPAAFESVLAELAQRTAGRGELIAVFGAAGGRDHAKRPHLGRIARRYTDYFFITNEDPCGEPVEAIIAEVAAGLAPAERGTRYECEPDRGRAIERALDRAGSRDTVIILGKGHEQSIAVAGREEPWSDARAVRQILGVQL